jgi:hypothetical protein
MDAGGKATQEQLPRDDLRELQGCMHAFSKLPPLQQPGYEFHLDKNYLTPSKIEF